MAQTVEEAFAAWRLEHPETAGWPLDAFRAGWEAHRPPETFVLILVPTAGSAWPAVIGGYSLREIAEAAGRQATMAHITQEIFEDEGWGMNAAKTPERNAELSAWASRPWMDFTVIPGGVGHG